MHQQERFTLKRELDFGDILTACSILVSVLALMLTWLHDQKLKSQAYADDIRKSAAAVTGKLERWSRLSDLYFEDVMPSFVTVSAEIVKKRSDEPANGDMYKGLEEANLRASERVSKEELETSYMELYRYVPELQIPFDDTINRIKKAEYDSHDRLSSDLQSELQTCLEEFVRAKWSPRHIGASRPTERSAPSGKGLPTPKEPKATTAEQPTCFYPDNPTVPQVQIGNDLRGVTQARREQTHTDIEQITMVLRARMICMIKLSDKQLNDSTTRAEAMKRIVNAKDITADNCPK